VVTSTGVKDRGLKDRNPFTQRVVQQVTNIGLQFSATLIGGNANWQFNLIILAAMALKLKEQKDTIVMLYESADTLWVLRCVRTLLLYSYMNPVNSIVPTQLRYQHFDWFSIELLCHTNYNETKQLLRHLHQLLVFFSTLSSSECFQMWRSCARVLHNDT